MNFSEICTQVRADAAQQRDEAQGRALVATLVSQYKLDISESEKVAAKNDAELAREDAASERASAEAMREIAVAESGRRPSGAAS